MDHIAQSKITKLWPKLLTSFHKSQKYSNTVFHMRVQH